MVTERTRSLRLLALALLLAAIVLSGRGGFGRVRDNDTFAAQCELAPPADADILERCLALQPRDVELMLDLGSIYERNARLDRAELLYRRALTVYPKDADMHVRLGRVLLGRGDRSAAASEARAALAYQPRGELATELLSRAEAAAHP